MQKSAEIKGKPVDFLPVVPPKQQCVCVSVVAAVVAACVLSLASAVAVFHFRPEIFPQQPTTSSKNKTIDLGEATVDDNVSMVFGPAVANLRESINGSILAHNHHITAVVHAKHGHRAGRHLEVESSPSDYTLQVTLEYANRSQLPPSAEVVEAHGDGILRFDLRRPDDESLEPWECDLTSCHATAPASVPAGRALRSQQVRESVRWVCGLTCGLTCDWVTTLVEEAFVTWACEPLADYICADLIVVIPNATEAGSGLGGGEAISERNFCLQAVLGACGSELPLSAAVDEMAGALTRHFEREARLGTLMTIGVDFVGTALDYAIRKLDEVTPDEWGIANSTFYLFNQRWVERVEEVCDTVCTETCTAIVVTIVEWISSLCYPADAPVRTLSPSGVAQLTRISSVKVGDLVQTPHGYEPIVFQGHASMHPSLYMVIRFDTGHTLELSPDHYFKRADAAGYVLAQDVEVGMAAAIEGLAPVNLAIVTSVEKAMREGAFNPYTPSGEIIIADVHASCHSSWLLEAYPSLVAPKHVPAVYQALLAPVRAIHRWAPGHSRTFAERFEGRSTGMGEVGAFELLSTAVGVLKA